MPSPLWHWQYFQTRPCDLKSAGDGDYYNGGRHPNTWCRTCIASCTGNMEREDQQALENGTITKVRPQIELLRQALLLVRPIPGRREAFEAHIRSCKLIPPEAKDRLALEHAHACSPATQLPSSVGLATDSRNSGEISLHQALPLSHHSLSKEQQTELNSDLCKLWVANGFPWHAINAPETYIFFQKWLPNVTLPDRHQLSGPILRTQLEAANASMHKAISGRLATGMSDGWKNIKRNALLASMLSVDYKTYTVRVHDLSAQHKTADNHLKLVLNDIDNAEKEHKVHIIAWVSDAGGDSRAMRVRLHRLRPHILVFDCWAHQINLIVGDILSLTSPLVDAADAAIDIIKWMLNHSYLLGLFHEEQTRDGRKPRTLTLPVLTRWTSHYLSFCSLLSESRSLRALAARNPEAFRASAGRSPKMVQQAEIVLKNIEDPQFWRRLEELKLYLQPLAIAANVAQAATTRLDHILVELGRLYYTFSHFGFNPKIQECVLGSLQHRFGKSDQEPMILAVCFNPFIRGRLFSQQNTLLNRSALYGIVKRVFRRVFCKENDLGLYEGFIDYYDFRNEFSLDQWDYEEQRAMYERAGKPLNMVNIWSGLLSYETPNSGRHQLAHLAIHILSIVANSAGCERLFSEMGHIHTKRRNRLGYQKVFDTAVVRMDLKRKHADDGRMRSRLKRQFGSPALDSIVSRSDAKGFNQPDELAECIGDIDTVDEELGTTSVRSLATQLQQDLLDDEDPPDCESDEESHATTAAPPNITLPKKVRLFFGTYSPILLCDLFDYSLNTGPEAHGLDIFKSNGLDNLEAELELYGLVTRDIQRGLESDDSAA